MSKTGSFARHYLKWYLYKCPQFRQKYTTEVFPKCTKKFTLSILTGMEIGTKTTTLKSTINILLIGLITPTDTQFAGHSNKHHLPFANWQQPNNSFLTWGVCNVKRLSKEVIIYWGFPSTSCYSYWGEYDFILCERSFFARWYICQDKLQVNKKQDKLGCTKNSACFPCMLVDYSNVA